MTSLHPKVGENQISVNNNNNNKETFIESISVIYRKDNNSGSRNDQFGDTFGVHFEDRLKNMLIN